MSDGTLDISTSVLVTPLFPDHTSLLTLYFPEKTDEYGTSIEIAGMIHGAILGDKYSDELIMVDMSQITEYVQLTIASPLDLFGVLVIEMVKDV